MLARRLALVTALAACSSSSDPAAIRISEVMYHPVAERAYDDVHEFVELANIGDDAVSLGRWRLIADHVDVALPAVTIAPGGYVVVAKTAAGIAAVWNIDPALVIAEYDGNLDNGKDDLRLFDDDGDLVDRVIYEDAMPWPIAADALGAGAAWLPPSMLPLESHENRGVSLERVSLAHDANDPANWVASPLDGATPGRANAGAAAEPLPLVIGMERHGAELTAVTSKHPNIAGVDVEWFVDDIAATGEPTTRTALAAGSLGRWSATLPPFPDHAIVRYRFLIDGAVVSPRATDPYAWHAFAQVPPIATETRVFSVYIAPADWGRMWTNLQGGRDSGCTLNPTWDDEVPAVLVVDGEVFDVTTRYQGSRYNRTNGPQLPAWPHPGPAAGPNPPRALSWHFSFPRYHRMKGRDSITLNKNFQGCPGYAAGAGFPLWDKAGLPAPDVDYARLHVNGGYYHYMVNIEAPGTAMMERYGPVGRLYKAAGHVDDSGALGPADERPLAATCGLTREQRYELAYDEHSHNWESHAELIALTDDLATARAAGVPAMRQFFADRFDLDAMLDHMAIMNWAVPFDDMWQNHFLYRKRDGRWIVFAWDLDLNFGGWKGAGASLYIGEEGDPDNRSGWWNVMKDSFIKAYRAELGARMRKHVSGILSPASVAEVVDAFTAKANPAEAMAAPISIGCSFPNAAAAFKQFAVDRKAVVEQRTPP